jgi:hypothetical protein
MNYSPFYSSGPVTARLRIAPIVCDPLVFLPLPDGLRDWTTCPWSDDQRGAACANRVTR